MEESKLLTSDEAEEFLYVLLHEPRLLEEYIPLSICSCKMALQ